MNNFNVEQRNPGQSWFRHSNHSNEYTAFTAMDYGKSCYPNSQFRVVDGNGCVRGFM